MKKSTIGINDGTAITSSPANAMSSIFSTDGLWIYYINMNDSSRIYKKSAMDTLNGAAVTVT